MILSKPVHRSINSELAPCTIISSQEHIPSTSRTHKHSLSKPMIWLNRTGSSISNNSPKPAPKPTRISEPKLGSSLDQLYRCGPLGSGATVVRTPQEALSGSSRVHDPTSDVQVATHTRSEENDGRFLPPPPSPPLPPLPDTGSLGEGVAARQCATPTNLPSHPRSSDSPSPKPRRSSSRLTPVAHSRAPSRSIPAPLADPDGTAPQPPFQAVLLSTISDRSIDPSELLVTLETCTTTFRTSLRTLVSRPSHLSRYITSLLKPTSETASLYSNASDASLSQHDNSFTAAFHDHLASSTCLPHSSSAIHVFLDRPSAPYTHVLAYLRSLPVTPDQPETLPRAVQRHGSHSPSHLESLLELCDEASYLGLESLHKLCCVEITRLQRVPAASESHRAKTGSVRSFRTVVEQSQPFRQELSASERHVSKGTNGIRIAVKSNMRESSASSSERRDMTVPRERGRERKGYRHEVGSPPPGWI